MAEGGDAGWELASAEDIELCKVLEPKIRTSAEKEWHEKCWWTCRPCCMESNKWPQRFDWMSAKQHAIEYVVCS